MKPIRYLAALSAVAAVAIAMQPASGSAQSQASASSSATDPTSVIPKEMVARYAHAKWTYPDSEQMAKLYPMRAENERVSGIAVIACLITPDGYMDRCAVANEAPKDYGFGVATATAFVKYTRVDPSTVEGGIKPGDFKVFTYKWLMG